jgi:hypothetical protein
MSYTSGIWSLPAFPVKDPSDSLNYAVDFSAQMTLDSDTLSTIVGVTTQPTDLEISDTALVAQMVAFRAAGGTLGTRYVIEVEVTTTGGNTFNRGFSLLVIPT